jgi:hypothetical protein
MAEELAGEGFGTESKPHAFYAEKSLKPFRALLPEETENFALGNAFTVIRGDIK